MEKLIELLNEREKTVNWVQHPWWCKEHLEYQCHWPRVINKRFWFIKWLVENDKIDLVKVYENLTNYEIEIRIRAVKELLENNEEDTIAYLKLLMLLAIQDEPIRFLCEIIK